MKKLMKKIKSNKLIPKLFATLTICMVLLSSLSVSAFAADDELSASNEETESITDVWTDVIHWITSSLSSAQGVFYGSSSPSTLDFGDAVSTIVGLQLYPISNFPTVDVGDSFDITLSVEDASLDATLFIYDSSFDSGFNGVTFSKIAVAEIGDEFEVIAFFDPVVGIENPSFFDGWYAYYPFNVSFSGDFQLTFLGTLAVIGVAIAIAFLLISVLSRFLLLRG